MLPHSSMVVSVLVDPREVVDSETDRVMPSDRKSLSRIFVVVLLDSVKYVTYSCVAFFLGQVSISWLPDARVARFLLILTQSRRTLTCLYFTFSFMLCVVKPSVF